MAGQGRSWTRPSGALAAASVAFLLSRHTYLAGLPGVQPLAALALIAALSWCLAAWIVR
jgi:biotin-(acetyl-CoA carboxylase) ligase